MNEGPVRLWAIRSPFGTKEPFRARGYRWMPEMRDENDSLNGRYAGWRKTVPPSTIRACR